MRVSQTNISPISLVETLLQEVDSYTYLGGNVDNNGGTQRHKHYNTQEAFMTIGNVLKANEIKIAQKLRIFDSNE